MRGGVRDSWVLFFNKQLVPNQIMSVRTLQKASFSWGKSQSSPNSQQGLQDLWVPTPTPLNSRGFSASHSAPATPATSQVDSCLWDLTPAVPLTGTFFPQMLVRLAHTLTSFLSSPNCHHLHDPFPRSHIENHKPSTPTPEPILFSKAASVSTFVPAGGRLAHPSFLLPTDHLSPSTRRELHGAGSCASSAHCRVVPMGW